jgi:alpha-L-fucosidase 2
MSVPLRQKAYQAFGDLLRDFPAVGEAEVTGYRRAFDLDTAAASVEYTVRGVAYRRDILARYPAEVIVIHLPASRPGKAGQTYEFGPELK